MSDQMSLAINVSAVAIGNRAILIEGEPGTGKSSLALALIDRGAVLIGDDGVSLFCDQDRIIAAPPPKHDGKLEIRNIGLVDCPIASAPLALVLNLTDSAERFRDRADSRNLMGVDIPMIDFFPGVIAPAERAEWALRIHGLAIPDREGD